MVDVGVQATRDKLEREVANALHIVARARLDPAAHS